MAEDHGSYSRYKKDHNQLSRDGKIEIPKSNLSKGVEKCIYAHHDGLWVYLNGSSGSIVKIDSDAFDTIALQSLCSLPSQTI